jgi:hypothetical protein
MTKRPLPGGRFVAQKLCEADPSPVGCRTAPRLLVSGQEAQYVVQAEAAIAALAHPIERELAPVTESLYGVHVEMEHVGNLARCEHRSDLAQRHRRHVVLPRLRT